jgi:hypothetical protein
MNEFPYGSAASFLKGQKQMRRALDRSLIRLDEFASNVLSGCSLLTEPLDDAAVSALSDTIPDAAIPLVLKELERVLAPDYRLVLHVGGPSPTKEQLMTRDLNRERGEARIIEVASALKPLLLRRRN